METNEAIQILKEQLEGYVHNPIEKAISLAIKALESVSKADNGEVKSAEEILKKYGIIVCSCENCQSINETHIKATHEYHNQFPSVKVGSGSVMSPNEIVNACKEELLKQLMPVVYENGYPIKAVPQAAILELPALMRSRMSNDKTE